MADGCFLLKKYWLLAISYQPLAKKMLNIFNDIKNTIIITVGNDFRSDDGVGPYIYRRVMFKNGDCPKRSGWTVPLFKHCHYIINAGINPENIIDDVINLRPKKIIIIDCADFKGKPGEIKIIPEDAIPETSISTHTIPMPVITQILKNDTGAEIYYLGIQPKNIELGEGLSKEVKKSADSLCRDITSLL